MCVRITAALPPPGVHVGKGSSGRADNARRHALARAKSELVSRVRAVQSANPCPNGRDVHRHVCGVFVLPLTGLEPADFAQAVLRRTQVCPVLDSFVVLIQELSPLRFVVTRRHETRMSGPRRSSPSGTGEYGALGAATAAQQPARQAALGGARP
jgi:hypothetical protein